MSNITQLSEEVNKYFTSYFDEDLKLYEIIWHEASDRMDDEEYKTLMLHDRDLIIQKYNQVNYIIINLFNRLHTMTPELQDWSSATISPTFAQLGTLKVAIIKSKDFSTQFSLEQAMEEDQVAEGVVQYFNDNDEARKWLLGLA
ncbi:MAG TPA: hypothetical protein DCS93_02480 [Microscillaceae bacterium]|nr:hypothetical protein [Microscillaceae bacterium]